MDFYKANQKFKSIKHSRFLSLMTLFGNDYDYKKRLSLKSYHDNNDFQDVNGAVQKPIQRHLIRPLSRDSAPCYGA